MKNGGGPIKIIGSVVLLGALFLFLLLNTPVARLGSGFLIGEGRHVITYHDLVKDSEAIEVKFPNEDDIKAAMVYEDPIKNLAILELGDAAKVKREPLSFSDQDNSSHDNFVFTLGYPWTNTLEDRHTVLKGFLPKTGVNFSDLMPVDLALEPVHSGSPLIDRNRQVIGMVLTVRHAADHFPVEPSSKTNYAIPASTLEKALQSLNIPQNVKASKPNDKIPMDDFVEAVRNNVVLIEAR